MANLVPKNHFLTLIVLNLISLLVYLKITQLNNVHFALFHCKLLQWFFFKERFYKI